MLLQLFWLIIFKVEDKENILNFYVKVLPPIVNPLYPKDHDFDKLVSTLTEDAFTEVKDFLDTWILRRRFYSCLKLDPSTNQTRFSEMITIFFPDGKFERKF